MASLFCNVYAGLSYGGPGAASKLRRMVAVRAETVNPGIRKTEDKVVDTVVVTELAKPSTAYCRPRNKNWKLVSKELNNWVVHEWMISSKVPHMSEDGSYLYISISK